MKIIAIGDPHFQTDNIPEVSLFIVKIEELVKRETPDLIVILGDVLHTHERIHTSPLNKAYEFIDKMRNVAETIILVGNHDFIQNMQFQTTNHWMNGLKEWKNVSVIDKATFRTVNGYSFIFCPYVPPGRFMEALESLQKPIQSIDCIFAHQEFAGCKMGAIVSIEGDKWSNEFPQVISGHIHSKQKINTNIYYPGSAMQNAFGESEVNVIPVIEWETPKTIYSLREEQLGLPRKKIIYTDINNIEDIKQPETDDKIKITVSGVYDEFKAFKKTKKYKDLINKGVKVVFKAKQKENEQKTTETDFHKILYSLISEEDNPILTKMFERIVNNKNI